MDTPSEGGVSGHMLCTAAIFTLLLVPPHVNLPTCPTSRGCQALLPARVYCPVWVGCQRRLFTCGVLGGWLIELVGRWFMSVGAVGRWTGTVHPRGECRVVVP